MTVQNQKLSGKVVFILAVSLLLINLQFLKAQSNSEPLKIGIVGLTHSHVHWILGRPDKGDVKIVGIVEPNRALSERYSKQYGYSMDIVYNTMEEMIAASKPEAVTAFGSIF